MTPHSLSSHPEQTEALPAPVLRALGAADSGPIPYGYCHCGCGGQTGRARQRLRGVEKGEPMRFISGHNRPRRTLRAEDRGYETPCWILDRVPTNHGYVLMNRGARQIYVHRFVYEHMVGPVPESKQIDHLCRIRNCLRPSDLEVVTPAENTRRQPGLKLNREKVAEIRSAQASIAELALKYGVSQAHIYRVLSGEVWT